jgi:hypothetical protein
MVNVLPGLLLRGEDTGDRLTIVELVLGCRSCARPAIAAVLDRSFATSAVIRSTWSSDPARWVDAGSDRHAAEDRFAGAAQQMSSSASP